jgi:hypothetical protein
VDFGLLYEIEVPKPWTDRSEIDTYRQVFAQVELAEEMDFSHFWTVEHHFLTEFSHCSAPEVLYGAISQRTKKIRIGHGAVLLPFPYTTPSGSPSASPPSTSSAAGGSRWARPVPSA